MKEKTKTIAEIILGVFGCCLAVFTLFFGDNLFQQITSRSIFQSSPSLTVQPSVDIQVITPLPLVVMDNNGVSMRPISAGEFLMGSDSGESNEMPVHQVYIDSFYMDIYEVTNVQYNACVKAGYCEPLEDMSSAIRSSYYGNSEFDNYPVIKVNWSQAESYCEWRGGGLPTEAQWEKAARGLDGRNYPWGNEIDCTKANYGGCVGDTTEVGSYPSGVSPYGIYDMAGNVWEWVLDRYSETYYQYSPLSNPLGADSERNRALRGGSWFNGVSNVRTTNRTGNTPNTGGERIGFRCVRSTQP